MRTYVITGGTDGIGRGLAMHLLGRGDRVIAVASGEARGRALLEEAARIDAADRAVFVRADLSTLPGMREVIRRVTQVTDAVDGLVFGAQRFRPQREETPTDSSSPSHSPTSAGTCSDTDWWPRSNGHRPRSS